MIQAGDQTSKQPGWLEQMESLVWSCPDHTARSPLDYSWNALQAFGGERSHRATFRAGAAPSRCALTLLLASGVRTLWHSFSSPKSMSAQAWQAQSLWARPGTPNQSPRPEHLEARLTCRPHSQRTVMRSKGSRALHTMRGM